MKKVLFFLLASKVLIAGDMLVNGVILPSATVGFSPIEESLTHDRLFFKTEPSIYLGTVPLGGSVPKTTKKIYIKTNIVSKVSIKITDHNGDGGALKAQTVNRTYLEMKYKLMGNTYDMSNPIKVDLFTGINNGLTEVGTFEIEQDGLASLTQTADRYKATFDVEITAN